MKKLLSFMVIALIGIPAFAATSTTNGRSVTAQWGAAQRAVASKNQISAGTALTADKSSIKAETPSASVPVDKKNNRETERQACVSNNIGVGNTFVWASRYSNTNNYASMVEDIEVPENNVCFVRVELKSDDARISVSDIAPVYYEMGRTITCGAWADAGKLEKRILDAKKSARTWGTVAGAVGGAGVGVGAMELFGNKLIGGAVQGQRALENNELLRSQLLVLKEKGDTRYTEYKRYLQELSDACESWKSDWGDKPDACGEITYKALLTI